MRGRLLAGEAVSLPQVRQEYPEASGHVVRDVANALTEEGWRVVRERRKTDPDRPSTTIVEFRVAAKDNGVKLTIKEQVRQRLLAGEELCQVDIDQEYGTRGHTLRDVITELQNEGTALERDRRRMNPGQHPPTFNTYYKVGTSEPKRPRAGDRSASARIRAAFEAGDQLTASAAAKRFHCSTANFHLVVKGMRKDGVKFEVTASTRKSNGRKVTQKAYSITQSPHQEPAPVKSTAAEKAPKPPGRPRTPPPTFLTVDMAALPQLGTSVTITLLAITEDGDIAIGFRNGTGNWVTRLSGRS